MTPTTPDSKISLASTDKTLRNILASFAKAPGAVVFMTDADGNYTYLDGPGLDHLDIVPEQWLGHSIFEFLEGKPHLQTIIARVFKGETHFDTSIFGEHHFEDRLFPLLSSDDQVLGIAGIQVCVTDRIRAEEALRANNELLDSLFDSMPDNAYILDLHFNVLRFNAAAKNTFYGIPLVDKPCFQTIHGRDEPCPFCPVVESYMTGLPAVREYFEEKEKRFFELTSFPIRDQKTGEIIGATELARDITIRKQAAESLIRNEALLNDLLEILNQGVYLIDTSYTITRANKAMSEMYPNLVPLVGKKCYDTSCYGKVCPDCAAERMFREGKATTRTFFEKNHEDDPGVWLELNAFPLYEKGGDSISGAICIVRDVTPRIELESQLDKYRQQIQAMAEKQMHELRLSEARLRSILDTCGAAISFADHLGRYTYINGKFKEVFGYALEDLTGKKVTSVLSRQSSRLQDAHDLLAQVLRGDRNSFRETFELEDRDGRPLWGDISVNMIRGREPEDTQLISVILDVTTQQQLVEHLNRARISAEEASQAKSQFLATMSHEIRTPLNGVIGVSNLLMGTPLQAKQLEYAKLINASGESLLALINDILDFSKIEAGKFELSESEFAVNELVESVVRILASRAIEKDLEFIATLGDRVPDLVVGDEGRLRQILLNLVGNALKFTEKGGVRVHVAAAPADGGHVVLEFTITDTGIGIPEDRRNRLFRHFSQVDSSSSRTYGGTGLGLAISKRMVELMHGTIQVESEVGRGSVFSFDARLECGEMNDATDSTEKPFDLRNTRILLVGTGDIEIPALLDQLRMWKVSADTAPNSVEALPRLRASVLARQPYRLVIVNTTSDDSSFESLIRSLQDDPALRDTAVIGLTPLSEDWQQRSWRDPDTIRFISKPLCCSMLLDGIVTLLFRAEPEHDEEPTAKEPSPLFDAADSRPVRVLVAEDNRINQIVVLEILRQAGLETTLVTNGREAVDKAEREPFDIILMDCQMPVMDGYTATSLIRQSETGSDRRIPIIALTANATSEDEAKCLAAGMDAYCSKPIEASQLLKTIRDRLG